MQIEIDETGVIVKHPCVLNSKANHFFYQQISGFKVNTPLMGFSSVTIHAGSQQVTVNGLKKAEVLIIKEVLAKKLYKDPI